MNKYIIRRIYCSLILILLIGGLAYTVFNQNDTKKVKVNKIEKVKIEPTVIPKLRKTSFSLVMVGDALIHESVYADARNGNSYDFKPMLEEMKPIISSFT